MTDLKPRCPTCGDDGTADPCFCSDGFHAPVLAEFHPPVAQQEAQGLVASEQAYGFALASTSGDGAWEAVARDAAAAILRLCNHASQSAALITAQASQLEEARVGLKKLALGQGFGGPDAEVEMMHFVRDTLARIAPGIDRSEP